MFRTSLSALILLLFAGLATSLPAAERPRIYDFAPAYPLSSLQFQSGHQSVHITGDTVLNVVITVEKDGSVKKMHPLPKADSFLVNYVRPYLLGLKFAPATSGEKTIKSDLPVRIRLQPGVAIPDFFFPVDTALAVADRDLFVEAGRLLGVTPPGLLSFPSFSCPLRSTDSMLVYPYVLLHLQLDKTGALTSVEVDTSTYPAYTEQMLSAARYATYAPAKVKNKNVPADAYLLISFFPQVSYPNRGWRADTAWHASLLERNQLRLFPVKLGLLSKPLPRRVPGDAYPRTVAPSLSGRISAWVSLDTVGTMRTWSLSKLALRERKQAISLFKKMRFFPAITFAGRPVPFEGLMNLSVEDYTNIRIDFSWLNTATF